MTHGSEDGVLKEQVSSSDRLPLESLTFYQVLSYKKLLWLKKLKNYDSLNNIDMT